MHKLQITAIGDPADVLELVEFQAPAPGPGQVLVEVEAATINASDFLYISGQYFITPQPPSDVGAEGAGRVLAVGPGENESLIGARVLLLPTYRHGTWATHLIADTTDIVVVPDDIDTVQLAMVGINPMTALLLLRNYGDPSMPDRWIGQTAGNSAVGEYLIKLAKRFGWKTVSVVRREAAAELVRSWGGDRVVIDDENLESNLAESLSDAELDIVVDSVGGRAARQLAHHLRFGGTLVSYAALSGQSASVSVLELIGSHVSWTGFWEINWLRRTDVEVVHSAYRELVALVADGTLSARVARTMQLDDWKDAVSLAQGDKGREGKVVFVVDEQHRT
ncbi:MAG TPA: zinc-dependent alcohol dehydrogenase family protein [Mycobacterium sp.]|nr:zinc-dependent alcohol dehydrogenase family protein [Mycobacterium sp.]